MQRRDVRHARSTKIRVLLHALPRRLIYGTGYLIRKRAIRKKRWDLEENKKFGSRYTEDRVYRTHPQMRNPAWTNSTASCYSRCPAH